MHVFALLVEERCEGQLGSVKRLTEEPDVQAPVGSETKSSQSAGCRAELLTAVSDAAGRTTPLTGAGDACSGGRGPGGEQEKESCLENFAPCNADGVKNIGFLHKKKVH